MSERRDVEVPPFDLLATLRSQRVGPFDPCVSVDLTARRFVVAYRGVLGPVTLSITQRSPTSVEAEAWGEGASVALDRVPEICGAHDTPESFTPTHEGLRVLALRFRRMRMPRVPWMMETLIGTILQQRVAFVEAAKSWRTLAHERGEDAPGPHRLRVFPHAEALRDVPTWAYREMLVDRKRELAIRALLDHARHLPPLDTLTSDVLREKLGAIPGFGPWTIETFLGQARADADAVPTLDYWLPHLVSFALTGEGRADDARMLELLEPFRPHRFRVVRLLYAAGYGAQRRGPRKKTMMRGR